MKIGNSLSFQAMSIALPVFMKSEGVSSFSISVSSEGEEACINFGLPGGMEEHAQSCIEIFLETLDKSEKLLSAMRTVAKMKADGVPEKYWEPFIKEAEKMRKELYGSSVAGGEIDGSLFRG